MLVEMLMMMLVNESIAADSSWLCKEEASQRRGSTVVSCGIGSGRDENGARKTAFETAQAEFNRICNASSDCLYHNIIAVPKRTECAPKDNGFTCYRLVEFIIGGPKIINGAPQGKVMVRKGMTKKELLASLGTPVDIREVSSWTAPGDSYMWSYKGDICQNADQECQVFVEKGKVNSYLSIKLAYTDALE